MGPRSFHFITEEGSNEAAVKMTDTSWFDNGCRWSYILVEYDIHIRGKDGEFFGEGLVYLVGSR